MEYNESIQLSVNAACINSDWIAANDSHKYAYANRQIQSASFDIDNCIKNVAFFRFA